MALNECEILKKAFRASKNIPPIPAVTIFIQFSYSEHGTVGGKIGFCALNNFVAFRSI